MPPKGKKAANAKRQHEFINKLVLNQWLISLFGINTFEEATVNGTKVRPFQRLAEPLKNIEGLDSDNLHHFYHALVNSNLFFDESWCKINKSQILAYEENIVRHTQAINDKRERPITWKYFQWLTLLFVEIYLDNYFRDRDALLKSLNEYVAEFNAHWTEYEDIPPYTEDDLNKLCLQNATGSGKTLLMHVNLMQYQHYARKHGREKDLSRVILLTPNERLSEQHKAELSQSGIYSETFGTAGRIMLDSAQGLNRVDIIEITKLADKEGPNTIATRSLTEQNLLLVDEGHRGMSGTEEGAWLKNRNMLCSKGFTFEYSATFQQAVKASKNMDFENSYAKSVIFDYSYRWFYADGYGKDYQILNLPESFSDTQNLYLTACLLKYYQQLRIWEEKERELMPFHLEKPMWVFVGSTVLKKKGGSDVEEPDAETLSDIGLILQFIASFLDKEVEYRRYINDILSNGGVVTGLVDKDGNDVFAGGFTYLQKAMTTGITVEQIYKDILARLFNNSAGGMLTLNRIKGESGEIVLGAGSADTPFGLINVGDAKALCDTIAKQAEDGTIKAAVEDSEFLETMFAGVKESSSPVNLLIGSKKFVEGWDCWRVSTLGLMHVGKSEGAQIIQLFGRGVRLKGYQWSLKRSGHANPPSRPDHITDLETLNVFGIEADFMDRFREYLKDEGLPGNEKRHLFTIPMNVTYDFGKKLKVLRPKKKASNGEDYDFKKDAPVPTLGIVPDYIQQNRVEADWYPRIQAIQSTKAYAAAERQEVYLHEEQRALLDYDYLYFELERFKRERAWHNINISKAGIQALLADQSWYHLYLPEGRLRPSNYEGILMLQQVALELLKRYTERYYSFCKRSYLEPRLELRDLTRDDGNIPKETEYQMIVDGDEQQVILNIQQLMKELSENKPLVKKGVLNACCFDKHLYQPLFSIEKGGKIVVLPVSLNESEFQLVKDLQDWCEKNQKKIEDQGAELFLLRNMSRGTGIGFFEAGNFHPDFILWALVEDKQYITFVEPHGLIHEGPDSEKILFYQRIKDVERRLHNPDVILESFIVTTTQYPELKWGVSKEDMQSRHVLFMNDGVDRYVAKLLPMIMKF